MKIDTTANAYCMAVNNVAGVIHSYKTSNDTVDPEQRFDAFQAADVLSAAFCKSVGEVTLDISAAVLRLVREEDLRCYDDNEVRDEN